MTNDDKDRQERLVGALEREFDRGGKDAWCPWWERVDERYINWTSIVPMLHHENEGHGNEVTDYFVGKFVEVAAKAIPVINRIEVVI